jgi:hydrogenase maturation protease
MKDSIVDRIARAILYEGYILYPYRPALKNQQRWTIGGLYPPGSAPAQDGVGSSLVQAEVLVEGKSPTLEVNARFLHLLARRIGEIIQPRKRSTGSGRPRVRFVESLEVADQQFWSWQEAVERVIVTPALALDSLVREPHEQEFAYASRRQQESIHGPKGELAGVVVREQQFVSGRVRLAAQRLAIDLFKVSLGLSNTTPWQHAEPINRDDVMLRSLASSHAVFSVRDGDFVSLLDPPTKYVEPARDCKNVGVWPVLVGEEGRKDTMLAAPIILYDYPQVAAESPGDFYDGTEIDEMLALRILTLTDQEKQTMAAVDRRAGDLLSRTESLAREQLMSLHGAMRDVRPKAEASSHG